MPNDSSTKMVNFRINIWPKNWPNIQQKMLWHVSSCSGFSWSLTTAVVAVIGKCQRNFITITFRYNVSTGQRFRVKILTEKWWERIILLIIKTWSKKREIKKKVQGKKKGDTKKLMPRQALRCYELFKSFKKTLVFEQESWNKKAICQKYSHCRIKQTEDRPIKHFQLQ